MSATIRAWAAGIHLGLLQTGYLLSLQRAISAAHQTYATVVGAWLVGSLIGLFVRLRPRLTLVVGLLTYIAVQLTLTQVDFAAYTWPWWVPAIVCSGVYSGRFFTDAIAAGEDVGPTFAHETYGFVVGALVALVAAVFFGRSALWVCPIATGITVALLTRKRPR